MALEHKLRFRGDLEVGSHGFDEPHGLPAQEPGEQVLVDRGGQRRRCGVDARGIAAQRDRHRHRLAPRRQLAPVGGAHLVALPVHRDLIAADRLDAIHPDVADARLRVTRDDARQRDVGTAVFGPADGNRELSQIHVRSPDHGLLTGGPPAAGLGGKLGDLGKLGEHRQLPEQRVGDFEIEEGRDALADFVQAADAERQGHAALGAEQVHRHGKTRRAAGGEGGVLEQQRGSAARGLHAAIGDFGDDAIDRNRLLDADQLAGRVDRADQGAEVIECHDGRRRSRRSAARSPRRGNRRR